MFFLIQTLLFYFSMTLVSASSPLISDILVEGNRSIQSDVILDLMDTKKGMSLEDADFANDIRTIYDSGFFEDVGFWYHTDAEGRVVVTVDLKEKPSIKDFKFIGFDELKPSNLQEKLVSKKFTIIDERKLAADVRMIEQSYVEKGFYLAKVNYQIERLESTEVVIVFSVIENSPVKVSKVNLLGNQYFSDNELKSGFITKERRWTSWFTNSGTFKDEFVQRDKDYLYYIYRDSGFAEATSATPQSRLNLGRQAVDVSFYVEEGERFNIGKLTVSGDILFEQSEFLNAFALKNDKIYRISLFEKDMKTLADMYGNKGFAFADIVPKVTLNREKKIIDIDYVVTKGDKIYFRNIVIEGNSKTRDNVIRRNVRVSEGELFHATKLERSKQAIERLGIFKEVQILREPDSVAKRMDLRIRVVEKPTGTLNASIGASPTSDGKELKFFAQGGFTESNLFGKGWSTGLSGDVNPAGDWGVRASFAEPAIRDGLWSGDLSSEYRYSTSKPFADEKTRTTRRLNLGIGIGREIIEDLRLSFSYSFEKTRTEPIEPAYVLFTENGITERISQKLTYDKTDNYMTPTDGYLLSVKNILALPVFKDGHQFGKFELSASYFLPLVFSDSFKTNFRFAFEPAYAYPMGGQRIPVWERYTLGSQLDMRAYHSEPYIISPRIDIAESPYSTVRSRPIGGNRRVYGIVEYFLPVIPEANLRFVTFYEAGAVLSEEQAFHSDLLKHDVGFGFRWQTPIAPFRFEWAWQLNKRKLGHNEFIFFVGFDNQTRF